MGKDPTLDYISRCLLEEEIDELNINTSKDESALQEIEKNFYEILRQEYPPPSQSKQLKLASCRSEAEISNPTSACFMPDTLVGRSSVMEFHRGIEEGLKFLPSINNLATHFKESNASIKITDVKEKNSIELKLAEKEDVRAVPRSRTKKKNPNCEDLDTLEGRSRKISVIYCEEPIKNDVFDKVLLDHGHELIKEEIWSLQEDLQHESNTDCNEEVERLRVELCRLLIRCSEAGASNDQSRAQELLTEIRMRSSPDGIGIQRLASVLANALEARFTGTGRQYYDRLVAKLVSAPETFFLKAHHMFLFKATPFGRVNFYFSNRNILNAAKDARKLHVIDFGIRYGFQWPSLIQALAKREGGPPQLRITGVELPEPGFRPAKRVEIIGRRLEEYARSFDVPFGYKGIASPWELICIEDLNIDDDEVVAVNTIIRFKKIKDETFETDSPRNRVLKLIWDIKPRIFIQAEHCFSYSPYFPYRFKQVLSTYSVFFDMLDGTIPHRSKQRQPVEDVFLVADIVNAIACDGSDLTERPETQKQWQRRNLQAGFEQLPADPEIVKECKDLVKTFYDKRCFIGEDGNWLLQGWKGRVLGGITAWKRKLDD